ncbi:lytic murein transglycosylase [Desulfosediminicola flagellatus]|uniref:lytic murein transglycosylase n=1 Tax=Desulfosediminicola flagellatus TaxID=2569541 RepID=UPI0010AD2BAA|nr:lytic murein transglycosylase [Desulfosediminicola flagellatus]
MRSLPTATTPSCLMIYLVITLSFILFATPSTQAAPPAESTPTSKEHNQRIDIDSEKYRELFAELIDTHGFEQNQLRRLFAGVTLSPTVLSLIDNQQPTSSFNFYLKLIFTPAIIEVAKQQLTDHKLLLDNIETEFGVDREYIIAIWAIETRFGQNTGKYNVFQTLNTLFDAYPRRSQFFKNQLVHFLLLCRENSIEPKTVKGSYAGAFGQTQFIPSSFREFAVSFDGDTKRDVFTSVPDILASIANYLKRHHWVLDGPVFADLGKNLKSELLVDTYMKGSKGRISWQQLSENQQKQLPHPPDNKPLTIIGLEVSPLLGGGKRYFAAYTNFRAITAWNHSNRYAMAVSQLAMALAR